MADDGGLLIEVGSEKKMPMGKKPGGAGEYAGIAGRLKRALDAGDDSAVAATLKRIVQDCMDEEKGSGEGEGDRQSGEY